MLVWKPNLGAKLSEASGKEEEGCLGILAGNRSRSTSHTVYVPLWRHLYRYLQIASLFPAYKRSCVDVTHHQQKMFSNQLRWLKWNARWRAEACNSYKAQSTGIQESCVGAWQWTSAHQYCRQTRENFALTCCSILSIVKRLSQVFIICWTPERSPTTTKIHLW